MKNSKDLKKIKGDASFRTFYRSKKNNSIVVYAKKEKKKNLLIYDAVNKILIKNRISAPNLISHDYKKNFIEIKNPLNLEKITRIFFSHRRKMLKKPFNQIFNGNADLLNKFNLDLSLRPQNLDFDTYYKLTMEYEKLRS